MSCQCHKVPGYVLLRFGNVVSNGAISIKQWGFINERFKVNPVGQWGKILVMAMGFVDHLGKSLPKGDETPNKKSELQSGFEPQSPAWKYLY